MTARRTIGTAAILALVLTSCAGANTIVVSRVFYDPFYSTQFFRYAAREGTVPVHVYGNPFSAEPLSAQTAERIASTLFTPGWLPYTRFTTHPVPALTEDVRVVLVFNPEHPAPGGSAACDKPVSLALKPGSGPIRVQAAFCFGGEWLTEAFAEGPPAKGPDDLEFQRLINQLMPSLFPIRNPEREGDDLPRIPWTTI
jgi:hypothetical protein